MRVDAELCVRRIMRAQNCVCAQNCMCVRLCVRICRCATFSLQANSRVSEFGELLCEKSVSIFGSEFSDMCAIVHTSLALVSAQVPVPVKSEFKFDLHIFKIFMSG